MTWTMTRAPISDSLAHWEVTDDETGDVIWDEISDETAADVFERAVAAIIS